MIVPVIIIINTDIIPDIVITSGVIIDEPNIIIYAIVPRPFHINTDIITRRDCFKPVNSNIVEMKQFYSR